MPHPLAGLPAPRELTPGLPIPPGVIEAGIQALAAVNVGYLVLDKTLMDVAEWRWTVPSDD